jgi:hypothetical protein
MSHLRLQFQDAQGRTGSIRLRYIFHIYIQTNLCQMYTIFHVLRTETLRLETNVLNAIGWKDSSYFHFVPTEFLWMD